MFATVNNKSQKACSFIRDDGIVKMEGKVIEFIFYDAYEINKRSFQSALE